MCAWPVRPQELKTRDAAVRKSGESVRGPGRKQVRDGSYGHRDRNPAGAAVRENGVQAQSAGQEMCMDKKPDYPGRMPGLPKHVPDFLRKVEIWALLRLTAGAFKRVLKAENKTGYEAEYKTESKIESKIGIPSLYGADANRSLTVYREFTAAALSGRSREELAACRKSLYKAAYAAGRIMGLLPQIAGAFGGCSKQIELKKQLIVFLYRNIEIVISEPGSEREGSLAANREASRETNQEANREADQEVNQEIVWHIRIPYCSFAAAYTPLICHVMSGLDAGIICGIFGGGRLVFDYRLTEGRCACRARYERIPTRQRHMV